MVVAVFEEQRHDQALKEIWLQDLPRTAMRHPCDDVLELLLRKDGIKLDRKLLHSDRTLNVSPTMRRRRSLWSGLLFDLILGYVAEIAVPVDARTTFGPLARLLEVCNRGKEAVFWFLLVVTHCRYTLLLLLLENNVGVIMDESI